MTLYEQTKRQWRAEDYQYLSYLKHQLWTFNALYLKYFDKPLYREINTLVLEDIQREMEATNASLGHKTDSGSIHYRLAGDTSTAG